MKRKSFELRSINLKNGHTGLSLYQYPLNGQAQGEKPRLVVRAWGTPLQAVTGEVLNLLKSAATGPTALNRAIANRYCLMKKPALYWVCY